MRRPRWRTLFPYTTLFRSHRDRAACSSCQRSPCAACASALSECCRETNPRDAGAGSAGIVRSEEHTSELQSRRELVCRLLLEKKNSHSLSCSTLTGGGIDL